MQDVPGGYQIQRESTLFETYSLETVMGWEMRGKTALYRFELVKFLTVYVTFDMSYNVISYVT